MYLKRFLMICLKLMCQNAIDNNCNNDTNDNHSDKDDNNRFVSNVFFAIRSLISGRCSVPKKNCFMNRENILSKKLLIYGKS